VAGVPAWYHDGMVCTGETYKDHMKMSFAKGAALGPRLDNHAQRAAWSAARLP